MPGINAADLDLDHVAVGTERQLDVFPRYGDELGGRWEFSHGNPVFDFSQLSFANGMRVEILEPTGDDPANFLRRFLRQSGPGPHHLTYKVRSLDDAIAAAESMGYAVVSIDRADPDCDP